MIRKLLVTALALALFASACGDDQDSATEPTSTTTAPTPSVVASTTAAPTTTAAPRLANLRVHHPETLAFAAPFTLVDGSGALAKVTDKVTADVWATPDVLRSLLVNGQSDVTAVPTYVGANLANRGIDVRMAAVVVWGLLWVIGPEGTPASWESLRGQTVMVPFPNDMPDLVFRYLAKANGLTAGKDFTIESLAQPPEAVARLVAGRGTWAVLPEHVATVALAQAKQAGRPIGRVFDLQREWAATTGSAPRIPQAGIVVTGKLAGERPDVVGALLDDLEAAVAQINAAGLTVDSPVVAALAKASGVPAPVVLEVIPRLNLDIVSGAEARAELERFYSELATSSPDIIGGKLPAASFYLADPR